MNRAARIGLKVLGIIAGVVAVVVIALQIALNSRLVPKLVDKFASEKIEGKLEWSNLHFSLIRNFPVIRVDLDSLLITYPHDRYASFDSSRVRNRLLDAGRGEEADTLLGFSRFSAAVNPWRILGGRIRLKDATLGGLRAYLHFYNDSTSNLSVFRSTPDEEPDSSGLKTLPWISLGPVRIEDNPRVVYTAQEDTVFAALRFSSLELSGRVKLDGGERQSIVPVSTSLYLDSLRLFGRLPADTLAVALDRFGASQDRKHFFNVGLSGRAMLRTGALGRIRVPVDLSAGVFFGYARKVMKLKLDDLDASIAYVPLKTKRLCEATFYGDSTVVSGALSIPGCKLNTLLREYVDKIAPASKRLSTNAVVNLDLDADGVLSASRVPAIKAVLDVPSSQVRWDDINSTLALDAEADMSPSKRLDADIDRLKLRTSGLDFNLSGSCGDALGVNPAIKAVVGGNAVLDSLVRFLPADMNARASGNLDIALKADFHKQDLDIGRFNDAAIEGHISGDRLFVTLDTLVARTFNPEILLSSGNDGVRAEIAVDSLFYSSGDLHARVRDMSNTARIYKVERRGKMTPALSLSSDAGRVFVKSGSTRAGLRSINLEAMAVKRPKGNGSARRKHFLDSLQRVYPSADRKELVSEMMKRSKNVRVPDYLSEKDFAKADLNLKIDSDFVKYLNEWAPSGSVKVARGFVATPSLPLRTGLRAFDFHFDDRTINLDTLGLKVGTSDIGVRGEVKGLLRALRRKSIIDADVDIVSRRINANELVAALQMGRGQSDNGAPDSEALEENASYVVDSLADARPDSTGLGLVVIPANLRADVSLRADHVDYMDLAIEPLESGLKVRDRTLQVVDTKVGSNLGEIGLDAFYSTITKKDISAGVNLNLKDISAEGILQLMPSFDTMMPALKSFKGKLGCDISGTAKLDSCMNVIMPSVDALIRISGENLLIEDAGSLKKITRLLLFKNKNIGEINDMYVDAVISNNRLEVFPFIIGVDRYNLALRGVQGFDKSMSYHVSILKSPLPIRFGINLYGSLDNWKMGLCRARFKNGSVPMMTQQLDSVQVNINTSIRDIFARGIKGVNNYNKKNMEELMKGKAALGLDDVLASEPLSTQEFLEIERLNVEAELEEEERRFQEEMDALIAETDAKTFKLFSKKK